MPKSWIYFINFLLLSHSFVEFTVFGTIYEDPKLTWADWWTYSSEYTGPKTWGYQPDQAGWKACKDGKYQSPIDISGDSLKYDSSLTNVHIGGSEKANGILKNDGRELIFTLDSRTFIHIHGGPLVYSYRLDHVKIHFGATNNLGSEHSFNKMHFPAEVQLHFYNDILFENYSVAVNKPNGLTVVSVFIEVNANGTYEPFKSVFNKGIQKIKYKGERKSIKNADILNLIPDTQTYVTYEGSITIPGCFEGVTWILYNRPISVAKWQMRKIRETVRSSKENATYGSLLLNNFRPRQPINGRIIRTNINGFYTEQGRSCSSNEVTFSAGSQKYLVNNSYQQLRRSFMAKDPHQSTSAVAADNHI